MPATDSHDNAPVLELDGVCQRFARRWALAHISLQARQGDAVLLTGENGAGKTTLLRIMATALRPTRGSVRLFGVSSRDDLENIRPRLALMTHQSFLYETLSAQENLALVSHFTGRGSPARVADLLEHVGLAEHSHDGVGTFSAGMKRRLMLARLLLTEPELLLLDEPFGQLDPAGVKLMEKTIQDFRAAGATLIISTHDVERGAALCNATLHLSAGRMSGPRTALP